MINNETNDIFCGSFDGHLNCAVKRYERVHKEITRIHNEIKIISVIKQHANVVELLFHTEDIRNGYLGMRKADNGDLFTQISMRKTLPPKMARIFMKDIINGLQHIHSHNIVHRRLCSDHILLTDNYSRCMIGGFADACVQGDDTSLSLVGEPEYMAPEQLTQINVSYPCDWWALGCILYETFAGVTPFASKNVQTLCINILNNEAVVEFELGVNTIIKHLLQKDAELRCGYDKIITYSWLTVEN